MRRNITALSGPLSWDLPGGKLDFGEDARKGIIREIKEETGLDVNELEILDINSGFNELKEFWFTVCYLVVVKNPDIKISKEHDSFEWVSPKEIQGLNMPESFKSFAKTFESL
jgi:8-oxo-dGTP pyrophosphatase MutT (NUDIX family)